jgi:hypothetical protein
MRTTKSFVGISTVSFENSENRYTFRQKYKDIKQYLKEINKTVYYISIEGHTRAGLTI